MLTTAARSSVVAAQRWAMKAPFDTPIANTRLRSMA